MGLCYARDEVVWLVRHHDNPPQHKGKAKTTEDLTDRQLPELLFHMEELRGMAMEPYSFSLCIYLFLLFSFTFVYFQNS